jgi:hypothetical protein
MGDHIPVPEVYIFLVLVVMTNLAKNLVLNVEHKEEK